jgi:isopenicillin N synthase-like dioxygenase
VDDMQVTNHGVPAPAGVVEGMLRVDGDLFHFHLPESSERLKCYSDDPIKAAEARALLESLGLELERSHMVAVMGRDAQPHMAVNYYPPCPQPELTYGLPGHKDPNAITLLLQDGVSGLQVQRGGRWVAVNPVPNALVINIGDQMQVMM